MKDLKKDMIWATYFYNTVNLWTNYNKTTCYDEEMWDYVVDSCVKYGLNTIFMTACDAVQYDCYPEISLPDAWSKERVKKEVARCRALGIDVIPELNFSSWHSYWLKDYRRTTSSKIYYEVCTNIINEVYEMFDHPKYIDLSMDEEVFHRDPREDMLIVRCPRLFFSDMKFLCDAVKKTGAKALIAGDSFCLDPEMFTKYVKPEDAILMPWYYWTYKPENFHEDPANPDKKLEEQWWIKAYREKPFDLKDLGYQYIVVSASCEGWDYCNHENMENYKNRCPEEQILGYKTLPWIRCINENRPKFEANFQEFYEARKEIYGIE